MIYQNILLGAMFFSFFLEGSVFSFPLVFACLALLYILRPGPAMVLVGFIAGFILDALRLSPVGEASFAIVGTFLIIEILKREVTFKDYKFVIFFLFIASYIYAVIFNYSNNLIIYLLLFGLATIIFSYIYIKTSWLK
jgi:hypothetical protein